MSKVAEDKEVLIKKTYSSKKNKKQKKSKKKQSSFIKLGIVLLIIAVIYFGGVWYYSSHFCPGTMVKGVNCSNLSVDGAISKIVSTAARYNISVLERGGKKEVIDGTEIGFNLVSIGNLEEAKKKQNKWLWPCDINGIKQTVDVDIVINEDLLYEKVRSLNCMTETFKQMDGMADKIRYDEEKKKFIFDDSLQGDSTENSKKPKDIVNMNKLYDLLKKSIYDIKASVNIDKEGCYVSMSEESTVSAALDNANKYVKTSVVYKNLDGDTVAYLDSGSIHLWIGIDNNFNVSLNEDEVANYVGELSTKYNTVGAERLFKTSSGDEITVSGGDYGWKLDILEETQVLCDIIREGQDIERIPEFSNKSKAMGVSDIGNTYAEISIAKQHIWFIKDGETIISSDVVTGNPNVGNATKTGVYSLKYKERNATLVGDNYRTPVKYWMPFNGGQGLHDANWRGSFGGSIYKGNGSHGCVNLPVSVAEQLFANINVGDPVIVY